MTRSAPLRYSDWLKKLDRGESTAALLFAGPETLLRDQAIALVKERAGAGVEVERYWASETSLGEVAAALGSVGLFASSKIVALGEIDRAGRAPAAEKEALRRRLADGHPGATFIATSDLTLRELTRKTEWANRLAEQCTVVELWHPRADEAMRWLLEECRRRKVKLSPSAGEALLSAVGVDLQELSRELEKLELSVAPGTMIEADELLSMIRKGRSSTVWELCEAWIAGRPSAGLRIWDSLRESEAVLRVQWLLQQKAREGQRSALTLRAYELEKAIKTGRIPSGQDELALEVALLAADLQRGVSKR